MGEKGCVPAIRKLLVKASMAAPKKKKVDYAAVTSPFARIPGFKPQYARYLLDLGFSEVHELQGRSPEAVHAALLKARERVAEDALSYIRLAVYYAENAESDPAKMNPHYWTENSY
mgnify:CR=1 FL=1